MKAIILLLCMSVAACGYNGKKGAKPTPNNTSGPQKPGAPSKPGEKPKPKPEPGAKPSGKPSIQAVNGGKVSVIYENGVEVELLSNEIKYDLVHQAIINDQCATCHKGSRPPRGVGLESFDLLRKHIDRVIVRSQEGTMPPSGDAPSAAEIQVLEIWVANGTPQ